MGSRLATKLGFHPLGATDFETVRKVLRRDDRFRLSHLGPLAFSLATYFQRRSWVAKAKQAAAAVPDDWHRKQPPILVVGFWRSGTTLLHELLSADPNFAAPTLIDSLCPSDAPYLLRHKRRLIGAIAPTNRAVDAVDIAPNSPQEEDFALCQLGAPSFFGVSYFPKQRDAEIERSLYFENDAEARAAWRGAHEFFLRLLTVKYPDRRLVLKNPPNSTRIPDLLDMYPDALFVRIDRKPSEVLPSFQRMTDVANRTFSLQGRFPPSDMASAEAFHARVMAKLDRDWATVPAGRRAEVRYENLIRDPLGTVQSVYDDLGLVRSKAAAVRQLRFWRQRGSRRKTAAQKAADSAQ